MFAIFRFLTRKQLRILCYHGGAIGDEAQLNPKLFCSAALLQKRLAWLARHSFTPLALDAAVDALGTHEAKWTRPVVITLDDGWYSSRANIVEPILKASFEPTLYLATDVMQRQIPVLDVTLEYVLWKAGARMHMLAGIPAVSDGMYDLSSPKVRQQLIDTMLHWLRARASASARSFTPRLSASRRPWACLPSNSTWPAVGFLI